MEQWMQKIEDKITRKILTPIQAHQIDHKERDSKRDETVKLDKHAASQTQPEEGHTEM